MTNEVPDNQSSYRTVPVGGVFLAILALTFYLVEMTSLMLGMITPLWALGVCADVERYISLSLFIGLSATTLFILMLKVLSKTLLKNTGIHMVNIVLSKKVIISSIALSTPILLLIWLINSLIP